MIVIEVMAVEIVLQRWHSPSFSSSSSSSLQDTKVIATPHQSDIIYSLNPPLDSLPIPTVTSPSNIAINSYKFISRVKYPSSIHN